MIPGTPDGCVRCRYCTDMNGSPGCARYQQHFHQAVEPLCEGRHYTQRAPFTWPPVDAPQ